jgi:fructosamine-3-kinase
MILNNKIISKIENTLNQKITNLTSLSGGCISDAYKLTLQDNSNLFLKYNQSVSNDMFVREAHGLEELAKAHAIRVPKVLDYNNDFILLELIEDGSKSKNFFEDFGRNFALMHKFYGKSYGFFENNFIGSNPQENIPDESEKNNWVNFYFNKRILFQLKLAEKMAIQQKS